VEYLSQLGELALPLLPVIVVVSLAVLAITVANYFINKHYAEVPGHRYRQQLITLALVLIGIIAVIITLPISDSLRGQLLGLIGIILSAAIALSSTTFVSNAMAGIMLRSLRNFRIGDFIRIGEHFGRVSEMGLLHVEIQTEDRDLMTVPNLYVVTQPTKVIRSSGTIVSARISLGYDVPRRRIEELLVEAARATGLEEPYVYVLELGDFSVGYQVNGLLTEVKQLITVRSSLRKNMLDELHRAGIEIVSPNFMNTRAIATDAKFIPPLLAESLEIVHGTNGAPETVVFDKAEEAESLDKVRHERDAVMARIKELEEALEEVKETRQRERLQTELEHLRLREQHMSKIIISAEK